MNMKSNTVTCLARLGLAVTAAAALVACGGGSEETYDAKGGVRMQSLDTSTCAPDASAASAGGAVPDRCLAFENTQPPLSCKQLFGADAKEFVVQTNPDGSAGAIYDETGAYRGSSLASLTSWLGVTVTAGPPSPLAWSTTDTATVDYQVVGVLIKNDEKTNIYRYSTQSGDSTLVAPAPAASILWYNICYIEKPVVADPQWCSPGYWKTHVDAWPVKTNTIYDLSELTVKSTGKGCSSAPAQGAATLLDVVSMPQCYGGEAANLVGDYLSKEAGLNFTGDRIDNCPLN